MAAHLNFHKWKECAFSVEQFRSPRWLLGSRPKGCPEELTKILTVSQISQPMHIKVLIQSFTTAGKKLRASAKAKMRPGVEDFNKLADFACVYAAVLEKGRQLKDWTSEKEQVICKCFMSRFLVRINFEK